MLQDAKLIEIDKKFESLRPLTTITLTLQGRKRFLEYLETLEQVVKDAVSAAKETTPSALKKQSLKPKTS